MPAHADTCAVLELDPVLAASGLELGLGSAPARGQGEEERISDWRAAPRSGGKVGAGSWRGAFKGGSPVHPGREKGKAAVLRIPSPQRTSDAPCCSRLRWAPWGAPSGLIRRGLLTCCGALTRGPLSPPGYYSCPSWRYSRRGLMGYHFTLKADGGFINRPSLNQPKRNPIR